MIITCPSCATRYQVDPAKFGAAGRRVRCSSCSNVWSEEPADDLPRAIDPFEASLDDPSGDPLLDAPGGAPGHVPGAAMAQRLEAARKANERASALDVKRPVNRLGWGILITIVAGVIIGGVLARDAIVRAWHPSQRLYAAVGYAMPKPGEGLRIKITGHSRIVEGQKTVLVIKGEIFNASKTVRDVPRLRASLRDDQAKELAGWTFATAQSRLLPGERAPFVSRKENPPVKASALNIDFTKDKK
ncbi:MAG: DUF3426 domain-containing protein [Rhodospirillales bacterium]|jgi:predicted Zn finger-like uncharacterized protein|nr:DUF3426 domain-containing protein [Rhodospirillales bacterium]MBT6185790.1 DUF3426 domain-containing protein [Rhodospirillales bacterium]MBT7644790.1 DUF3426 domain-containing protein [Rhodospirillales bacterium]MBT7897636.1 DUF3426 domain-containing protein [Rhodospirillales bacterium]